MEQTGTYFSQPKSEENEKEEEQWKEGVTGEEEKEKMGKELMYSGSSVIWLQRDQTNGQITDK